MSDSNARNDLDAARERIRERRIEAVKRWVEYVQSEPPETWGPQQNAIVDGQLDAAQNAGMSATDHKHVKDVAAEILDTRDKSDDSE